MRGKYITTTVILAVLSVSKNKETVPVREVLATTSNHRIIWSKNNPTGTTAPIRRKAELVC